MAHRTTISIPDELAKEMEKWKGEINFSKEFQRCIGEVIHRKELFKSKVKEVATMEEIIERLRSEMAESGLNIYEWGKYEGLSWAKIAPYDDIQFALKWNIDDPPGNESIIAEALTDYFNEIFATYDKLNFNDDPDFQSWADEDTVPFLKGWQKAVVDFWSEVEDKL